MLNIEIAFCASFFSPLNDPVFDPLFNPICRALCACVLIPIHLRGVLFWVHHEK